MNDRRKKRIDEGFAKFGTSDTDRLQLQIDVARKQLSDYQNAAKGILAPVKTEIDTKEAGQNVAPNVLKTTTGTDPVKQAADKVAAAQHDYAQSIEKARMSLDNGTKTESDYKKQLLSTEERLWEALGDAYNIHKDPKYKQAQDECAAKIKQLGGEVTASVEAQKKAQEASRELERAQKRLADAHRKLADAEGSGKYKDIVAARKEVNTAQAEVARLETVKVNVEPGNIELPDVPKEIAVPIKYTNENLDAFKAELKEKLNGAEVGSQVFKDLTAQLADATTLGNLMQTAIKNGIDISQFNPQDLWSKVFGDNPGDYIDDKTWDDLVKTINDELKKRGINGISIDKNTGSLGGTAQKKEASITKELGGIVGGVSSISNGVRGLGIEIPQGVQNVLNGMQSILSVLSGIATIVTAIQAISTAQMFKPFRNGGVVHAAGGYVVPGNYGYDAVPSLLTSGELVLNKAQQGVLASYLNNDNRGGRDIVSHPYVTGETIVLGANNYLKSRGQGEIVTTRMLKNMIR